jgi:hypothetical protein
MTLECVADAELFKKYCLDGCNSITDTTKRLLDCGADDFVILECSCLIEFLDAITMGRCIMCYDEQIRNEYIVYIDNMPEELVNLLEYILSNTALTRKINRGGFKLGDSEKLKSTELRYKEKYLDVAKCLMNKIIVSTKEAVESTYNPNRVILLSHDISAKNVCEQWTEIKKC